MIAAAQAWANAAALAVAGELHSCIPLEIAPGIHIVSIITKDAVADLGLKVGQRAYAIIKASSVMVGVDH